MSQVLNGEEGNRKHNGNKQKGRALRAFGQDLIKRSGADDGTQDLNRLTGAI
jgi:hypothetical protein